MATALDKSHKIDWNGLALLLKDADLTGGLTALTAAITTLTMTTPIIGATTLTATGAEINKLDDSLVVMTRGAGVDTAESYAAGVWRIGSVVHTMIAFDMSTLVGSATDVDIIGESGGAVDCNWGRVTTALNGTIIGGKVTCLEVPAGGTADINFYSSSASTGAQDALASGLAGVATLVDSGGAWTSGAAKGMTALPAANDYLYVANGAAAGGTFSAGKFLIELFGFVVTT